MNRRIITTMAIIITFLIIVCCSNEKVVEDKKLYNDMGNGICLIHIYPTAKMEKGYIDWKTDFPQRYKNIISIACDGHGSTIIIFYRTESELK